MSWLLPLLRPILMLFGFGFAVNAMSNLIGSITGQNPMVQTASVMMQQMLPFMITMMPMVLVMNMMTSMVDIIMAPFARIARPAIPAYTYFA